MSGDDLRTYFYQLHKKSFGDGDIVGRLIDGSRLLEFGGVARTTYRLEALVGGIGEHDLCDVANGTCVVGHTVCNAAITVSGSQINAVIISSPLARR